PITMTARTVLFTRAFTVGTGVQDFSSKLPPDAATLAQTLRHSGYSTAAFIGSAVLDSRFGLNRGFEPYFDHFQFGRSEEVYLDALERRGELVMDEAGKWLKRRPKAPLL